MKPLPIGIQDFSELITNGYLYIDKTRSIYDLIKTPKGYYFFSRPRRFGKSLLISTLEEIFLGNKELFKELWIENSDYQWTKHPVIRIDFSKIPSSNFSDFEQELNQTLISIGQVYDIHLDQHRSPAGKIGTLISELHQQTGNRVVVLIDEYDAPIISNINRPEVLNDNRELLAAFYRTIKGSDESLRFVFLTGVSKFSKVSVFSGLNNLLDATLDTECSSILGYTQEELEHYFAENISNAVVDLSISKEQLLEDIRNWYNGYRFSTKNIKVYNPFSVLLFFRKLELRNYWFETGTPTFLIELIKKNHYDIRNITKVILSERDFNSYDVEKIPLLPLLFNTGYLTISEVQRGKSTSYDYLLDYPNDEVRISFLEQFVDNAFLSGTGTRNYVHILANCLLKDDINEFIETIKTLFAEIPYDIQAPNRHIEAYYQSLLYCVGKLVGYETYAEERTNKGRIDLVVEGTNSIYLFEMKVDKPAADAIAQIKKRGYIEKFRLANKKLTLIGLSFSSTERNVTQFEIESA